MSMGTASLLGSKQQITPSGAVGPVGGPASSTDNAIARWDGTTGQVVQNSVAIVSDVGDLTLPSTATAGLQLYNTADQVTNYERLEINWSSNIATIFANSGGTGATRELRIGTEIASGTTGADTYIRILGGQSPFQFISPGGAGTNASIGLISNTNGSYTATSGSQRGLTIAPIYNQASGTAANTDLLVNRTETALGSGTQRLISLQVAGTERFGVSNSGAVVLANQTSGPGAGGGTLTNAPSAGNPDFWLPVTINGTAHWIPAWAA